MYMFKVYFEVMLCLTLALTPDPNPNLKVKHAQQSLGSEHTRATRRVYQERIDFSSVKTEGLVHLDPFFPPCYSLMGAIY